MLRYISKDFERVFCIHKDNDDCIEIHRNLENNVFHVSAVLGIGECCDAFPTHFHAILEVIRLTEDEFQRMRTQTFLEYYEDNIDDDEYYYDTDGSTDRKDIPIEKLKHFIVLNLWRLVDDKINTQIYYFEPKQIKYHFFGDIYKTETYLFPRNWVPEMEELGLFDNRNKINMKPKKSTSKKEY